MSTAIPVSTSRGPHSGPSWSGAALVLLGACATAQLGYYLRIGLERSDVGPFETVLARAVAGHFEPNAGPGRFYGPFGGDYPSVLMHAPLYYRLVALAAGPAIALGADPLTACLYAGRGVALWGAVLLFLAVHGWARLDGAGGRAGWLATALLAGSPILGNLVAMVRPDTLGVGLQTLGGLLALRALNDGRPALWLAISAFCFALAFCVKQQNITVAAVCGVVLVHAWLRGRLPALAIVGAIATGGATVALNLGIEAALTGGRMFQTVFRYPSGPFRAINYAGWGHVLSIFDICARRSLGHVLLAVAALWLLRGRAGWRRLDALLGVLTIVELIALVPLCLYNAGAAYNYALQAIVFGCLLIGRLMNRALAAGTLPSARMALRAAPLFAAALMLTAMDFRWVIQTEHARADERALLRSMESHPATAGVAPDRRYFVAQQHMNRLLGRRSLIHDDWLYGAFEQIGAAEPRSRWLRDTIAVGPVRQVVVPGDSPRVPGVPEPLPALGYRIAARFGDLRVWER